MMKKRKFTPRQMAAGTMEVAIARRTRIWSVSVRGACGTPRSGVGAAGSAYAI
jgi:hypothetical protein